MYDLWFIRNKKKVKGERQYIKVTQTTVACDKIQLTENLNKDYDILLAATGEDLIAKEFKIHEKCYKDYTRVCSKPSFKNKKK